MQPHSLVRPRHFEIGLAGLFAYLILLASPLAAQVTTDYSIGASDGVLLEATLALPDSGTPPAGFPAVILIHGYGGNKDEMAPFGNYLTTLGLGCLTYSVRGQGKSGGLSTTMGPRETQDLFEVIQFLRSLPGINPEKLAVAGGSQGGIHAWIAATRNMPGVKVIASLVGPPSFSLDLFPRKCIKQQLYFELNLGSVRYDPIRDRLREFVVNDSYDSVLAFAEARDLEAMLDSVRIPVIQTVGWADVLFPVNGAIRTLQQLSSRGVPVWSYFGTNGHGEPIHLGEYLFELNLMTAWFNRWLNNQPLERATDPYVVYADDRPGWPHHETTGWPPAPHSTLRLYFSGNTLRTSYPVWAQDLPFTLTYDSTYTPARGWADAYSGAGFRHAFASSPARLVSEALADSLEITGIPHAVLQLSSTASRFQSHVRLFDVTVADTGLVWSLITRGTNGIRNNIPGSPLQQEFDCQALSHVVPAGHRIGVEVTSFDMYDATRAHVIPYFLSSASVVRSSSAVPSYVDLPLVGIAKFLAVAQPEPVEPQAMLLHQNFPNPFNASTTLRFSVASSRHVRLEVFNILGQSVAVLLDGPVASGTHVAVFSGNRWASGIYVCRLSSGGGAQEKKMVLVR